MLLPATHALQPVAALIMLAGIYYGAQYGGSTTAILVNLPGESSSVVTVIDGYQMARAMAAPARRWRQQAWARSSRAASARSSWPPLRAADRAGLQVRSGQYFSLMVLGLIGAVVLASGSLLKAIAMIISACSWAWWVPT